MLLVFIMRWIEFFEGAGNRLSMTRLMVFLSFWPASYVVMKERGGETLGWYLGAYVLGYVGGKGADVLANKKLEAGGDSDTVSDTTVTSTVVAKRRDETTGRPKRPF